MALNCHVCLLWPCMVLLLLFKAMAMCGLIRLSPCVVLNGHVYPFYGLIWHSMVFYGNILSFIAVMRSCYFKSITRKDMIVEFYFIF